MPCPESHCGRVHKLLQLRSQQNRHRGPAAREVASENFQKNPHRSRLSLYKRVCMHHGVALHVGRGAEVVG